LQVLARQDGVSDERALLHARAPSPMRQRVPVSTFSEPSPRPERTSTGEREQGRERAIGADGGSATLGGRWTWGSWRSTEVARVAP
jgi:hypothetical protein